MGFYEPKRGDRVRVVLEGEAHSLEANRSRGLFGVGANYINPENEHVMSVEKVEPPVVTFKPGDVVRRDSEITGDPVLRTLGDAGYINHAEGKFYHYGAIRKQSEFTSKNYELVELK